MGGEAEGEEGEDVLVADEGGVGGVVDGTGGIEHWS